MEDRVKILGEYPKIVKDPNNPSPFMTMAEARALEKWHEDFEKAYPYLFYIGRWEKKN